MTKIKIYSTTTCPFCKMEKEYLDAKGIPYENVFCDEDPKAVEELMSLSGQYGVPFTVITRADGTTENLLGFDRPRIDQILNLQ